MIKQEWKTSLRALVVGGAGFVGSHLFELTKEREKNTVHFHWQSVR